MKYFILYGALYFVFSFLLAISMSGHTSNFDIEGYLDNTDKYALGGHIVVWIMYLPLLCFYFIGRTIIDLGYRLHDKSSKIRKKYGITIFKEDK